MAKLARGEELTEEERRRLNELEYQRLLDKLARGEKLTPEEEERLRQLELEFLRNKKPLTEADKDRIRELEEIELLRFHKREDKGESFNEQEWERVHFLEKNKKEYL